MQRCDSVGQGADRSSASLFEGVIPIVGAFENFQV
jgi:hypothetical protein